MRNFKWFMPAAMAILLLLVVHVLSVLGGWLPTWWTVGVLGVYCGLILLGYLFQLNVLNRIGGVFLLLLSVGCILGMLLPAEMVGAFPASASTAMSQDFDSAWKTVYGKNLFKEFSLHESLMQYIRNLSSFDIHRAGQMLMLGLWGFAVSVCFLFPLNLSRRWSYFGRLVLLLVAGLLWSLFLELLQTFSSTREVSFGGFLESTIGAAVGVFLFVLFNIAYVSRKKDLTTRRFNVLGVGIDAVDMEDCLQLFEEIIGDRVLGVRHEISLECGGSTPLLDKAESNYLYPSQDETGTLDVGISHERSQKGTKKTDASQTRLPAMTTAMGVAGIVESRRNPKLQRILNESVLNTPDGMPLVWLGKLFGYRNIERVYGPDLLRDVCAYGEDKGWRHYFWGAAPGIVEKLKEVLEVKHPRIQISGICCPPFRPLTPEEEDALVEEVNTSKTDIFWIGISTPKQLYFMDHIRDRLNVKIICPVGYAFDVNAGVEKDAPDWIKYAGLQWLHRGIKQPRLWKRYLPDNPTFIFKVFVQLLHLKRFPSFTHERPVEPFADAEGYPRFPVGVVALSAMSMQSARDRVAGWIESGQKHYVNICTADTVVQCYDRPELAQIVMNAGMALTGSMPLVWLAHHFGFKDATRVYGPDLMLELCALSEKRDYSHYFYGATDEVLAELKANLLARFPMLKIAGMYSPPFRPLTDEEKGEVADRINAASPDIVWCGLGTPKQDYWVAEFRPKLKCAVILAVGAAFNFHTGHVKQAPRWIMKSGLEWLFCLFIKPKRLWGNLRFVFQVLRQRVRGWCRVK